MLKFSFILCILFSVVNVANAAENTATNSQITDVMTQNQKNTGTQTPAAPKNDAGTNNKTQK